MNEVTGDPQPSVEARKGLLEDVRSVRDVCAQDRARTENQLFAAQQTVSAFSTQLRIADEKLVIMEDLVGEVRTRMHMRGLTTFPGSQHPSLRAVSDIASSNTVSAGPPPGAITGGEPLFTHQVCVEFIVGSEPKYPAWAHQVHLDYFYNLPTNLPSICPPDTCWVFSKSTHQGTQHGPTEYRLGTF